MVDSAARLSPVSPVAVATVEPEAVRLRLIGQMDARTRSDESVLPAGRKTRALLACIAMAAPRPLLRGRLAEQLWSRRPEEQARASLRQEIHRLQEALAPAQTEILQVTRDHLTLRVGAVWIDVAMVLRATAAAPGSLALLDGELLEDLDGIDPNFDAWLHGERERLRDRARAIAEAVLAEGLDPDGAIGAAQRLLSIDRSHEGAWRALMKAHAAKGERGLALQAYDRCRTVLGDLLDATPSVETQTLLTEIKGPSSQGQMPARAPQPVTPEPRIVAVGPDNEHNGPGRRWQPYGTRGGAHIGVMPFRLVGVAEADQPLAAGLADEITDALSRFRWISIVSANSLRRYAADRRDEAAIRRDFALDFLLDGLLQQTTGKVRINLRVLDLRANNEVVWARRFDRETDDLLSLQDEIAALAAAHIDAQIMLIEARRSNRPGQVDVTAYELVLRAVPLIWRMERETFMQAGDDLAQAITLQPDHASAHAWYAYWHIFLISQGWAGASGPTMEKASALAERSIVLDPFDARGLTISGHVKTAMHLRPREALVLHERALSLNPNLAMAWALSAVACTYIGDLEEAERRNNRYKALSPMDPHAYFFDGCLVLIHLIKHDHAAAAEYGRAVCQLNPSFTATYKPYLAALGHLGRDQEAASVRRRLLSMEPDVTIERCLAASPMERDADRAHYAEGLRLAGVPWGDEPG